MRLGVTDEEIHAACKIDPWFLAQIRGIVDTEAEITRQGPAEDARARSAGSRRWASPTRASASSPALPTDEVTQAPPRARRAAGVQAHRHLRGRVRLAHRLHVFDLRDAVRRRGRRRGAPSDKKKVVILGGGPNRIGQGIEFDYCCCHAAFALQRGRLRDHHGQLQSGDGVDRLRHLGPALLRAADRRGRAGDHRHRALATARCTA